MTSVRRKKAFTLIELLIVIAIIAVLSITIVLTLNPAELLKQARDSTRLSDLATLQNAVNLSLQDAGGMGTIGNASTSYMSVADPSATSSLGDQCQGLGLASLATSSGENWQCSASTTYRANDGTGWLPINFTTISQGAPLGELPVDPVNQTSTGLFYSYAAQGSQYVLNALFESQKYKAQYGTAQNAPNPLFPEVATVGNSPGASLLYNPQGLVGYWPMDEGNGSTTQDLSGNGNTGSWSGAQTGASGYYSAGKVGGWAGMFDGSTTAVTISQTNPSVFNFGTGSFSIGFWMNVPAIPVSTERPIEFATGSNGSYFYFNINAGGTAVSAGIKDSNLNAFGINLPNGTLVPNTWQCYLAVFNRATNMATFYLNGVSQKVSNLSVINGSIYPAGGSSIWAFGDWSSSLLATAGMLDDVRIYNRALSSAEVQAVYNAEK